MQCNFCISSTWDPTQKRSAKRAFSVPYFFEETKATDIFDKQFAVQLHRSVVIKIWPECVFLQTNSFC